MKQILKKIIFGLLNAIFHHEIFLRDASILMYHSIAENGVFFTVKPSEFERQMKYLSKNNFNVMSLGYFIDAFSKNKKIPRKTVVLTFDDGYLDNYENAFPVLKKYNFPATIFVATGFVGGKKNNSSNEPLSMMTWEQIREIADHGLLDVNPHTKNHSILTTVSYEGACKEINESRSDIELKLLKKCGLFAYPHGAYNESIKSFLKEKGFICAVSTQEGLIAKNSDLFCLRRNSIDRSVSMEIFKFASVLF